MGHKFIVQTDHRAFESFFKQPKLNLRQIRWAEYFAQFDSEIQYRPGAQNVIADALNRQQLP